MCFSSIKHFKSLVFTLKASSFDIWMHRSQLFSHNQGIYLNQYGSSSQIETSSLIYFANKWTGFCRDLRHERFKALFIHIHRESNLLVLAFVSRIFKIHRTAGEGAGYLLISFLPLPSTWKTCRHYLGYCCRQLTSSHSWQPELNMAPLVHAL